MERSRLTTGNKGADTSVPSTSAWRFCILWVSVGHQKRFRFPGSTRGVVSGRRSGCRGAVYAAICHCSVRGI